jgi:hypothetical protein
VQIPFPLTYMLVGCICNMFKRVFYYIYLFFATSCIYFYWNSMHQVKFLVQAASELHKTLLQVHWGKVHPHLGMAPVLNSFSLWISIVAPFHLIWCFCSLCCTTSALLPLYFRSGFALYLKVGSVGGCCHVLAFLACQVGFFCGSVFDAFAIWFIGGVFWPMSQIMGLFPLLLWRLQPIGFLYFLRPTFWLVGSFFCERVFAWGGGGSWKPNNCLLGAARN